LNSILSTGSVMLLARRISSRYHRLSLLFASCLRVAAPWASLLRPQPLPDVDADEEDDDNGRGRASRNGTGAGLGAGRE
jgi:hypothetical protein